MGVTRRYAAHRIVTDTQTTGFTVCASAPGTGIVIAGVTLDTGNYG